MRPNPPEHLVELLARLKLASAEEVASVLPRVRRLAGDLPDFESVWVDALAQARTLTPFQAARINSGLGDALLVGSYVLVDTLPRVSYATCYQARHLETDRLVRLHHVERPWAKFGVAAGSLAPWLERLAPLRGPLNGVADDAGVCGSGLWAVCEPTPGRSAADWMVENGRFSPQVALHIAREMVARLVDLERLGANHGDISAASVLLDPSGCVRMPMPGFRSIVRPSEGFSFGDLAPEAYDTLSPERIAAGSLATTASELYACGCMWWHLLAGRPPFGGGNVLTKLQAVHAAKTSDIRQIAIDVPDALAQAISVCMSREISSRPRSFAEVAAMLGPAARGGAASLAQCLHDHSTLWIAAPKDKQREPRRRRPLAVASACTILAMLLTAGVAWRNWHPDSPANSTSTPGIAHASAEVASQSPELASRVERGPPSPAASPAVAAMPDESKVVPASVQQPPAREVDQELVLAGDRPIAASELKLSDGLRVRGRGPKRPRIVIDRESLLIACDDVRFENVDFVWNVGDAANNPMSSIVTLAAETVSFRGCSFSSASAAPTVAVACVGDANASSADVVRVAFRDCAFRQLASVVEVESTGPIAVDLNNCLCLSAGAALRLFTAPASDASATLTMRHVTLRGESSALECRFGRLPRNLGSIEVTSIDSVFDTNPRKPLLLLAAAESPQRLLAALTWGGEGSLVSPPTAIAAWDTGNRNRRAIAESDLDIAGLVRGPVEFAGPADGPLGNSQAVSWQAPLRSDDPPGVDTVMLAMPKVADSPRR